MKDSIRERQKDWKGRKKVSLFINNTIAHPTISLERLMKKIKNNLHALLIRKFNKIFRYKHMCKISCVLHISSKQNIKFKRTSLAPV